MIGGVLDEVILPDDLDSEDYPSFSTMLRWLQWFRENLQRMEGYLRTAGYQILNLGEDFLFSSDSLLDKIRNITAADFWCRSAGRPVHLLWFVCHAGR